MVKSGLQDSCFIAFHRSKMRQRRPYFYSQSFTHNLHDTIHVICVFNELSWNPKLSILNFINICSYDKIQLVPQELYIGSFGVSGAVVGIEGIKSLYQVSKLYLIESIIALYTYIFLRLYSVVYAIPFRNAK